MNPQRFALRAPDGRELAAHWIAAPRRRGVIVLNAGTGFPQTFYFKLSAYAADRGYDVLVYDYRGMGRSAPADLATELHATVGARECRPAHRNPLTFDRLAEDDARSAEQLPPDQFVQLVAAAAGTTLVERSQAAPAANRDSRKRKAPRWPNAPTASSTSRNGNAIVA